MSTCNQVNDHVYVRDDTFAWLPAVVLDVQEVDRVLVRIELPVDWVETTKHATQCTYRDLNQEERWVLLNEYYNHRLPLQNQRVCRDMAELDHVHEAEVLYQIKYRHCMMEKPYTRVGDIIVAVNPCHWIPDLYSTEKQQFYMDNFANAYMNYFGASTYGEEKKDDVGGITLTAASSISFGKSDYDRLGCEPHIYEVSALAYRGLTLDRKNQTILVSGESGSGKTESVKIVLQHLSTLRTLSPTAHHAAGGASLPPPISDTAATSASSSSSSLATHLLASSPIFEAFGNARTVRNNNSSRFGKVTKLLYDVSDEETTLAGVAFDIYLLESNRVVSHSEGERNFQIFYQLLAAPSDVKRDLLGPDWGHTVPSDFKYLTTNHTGMQNKNVVPNKADRKRDAANWNVTLKALITSGWDGSSLERLMRALGIVLLIGNISFKELNDNQAAVAKPEDLIILSFALGIPIEEMEVALTKRTIQTAQDLLLIPFTPEQAKEACDALAKAIYSGVFASIVRQINILTSAPPTLRVGKQKVISLVDIFGFESFEVNRFEQFCVNYASERLQQKYILDTLRRHTTEYLAEGVTLPNWKDIDNSSTIELFQGPNGLIKILNEQCIRPNGTSEAFVFIAKHSNRKNSRLVQDDLQLRTVFGVRHFAADVNYDASEFVERNADKLPDFLIGVTATSTNELISHELNNIMRESSTASTMMKKKSNHRSVIDKFSLQLKDLLESIDNGQTRYIKCIKPCEGIHASKTMDHQMVMKQLRCAGLVTAIELSQDTFPNKLSFESVERRFACLLEGGRRQLIKEMEPHDRAQLILSLLFADQIEQYRDSDFAIPFSTGHTKVFFRTGALESLETRRQILFTQTAVRIQQWTRKEINVILYRRLYHGFLRLQAQGRGKHWARDYERKRRSATRIQACTRSAIQRARFLWLRTCVHEVEFWWMGILFKLRHQRVLQAARILNAWCRMILVKRKFRHLIRSLCCLQARQRGASQRRIFQERKVAATDLAWWGRAIAARLRYLRLVRVATLLSARARGAPHRMKYVQQRRTTVLLQARARSRVCQLRYREKKQAAQVVLEWSKSRLARVHFVSFQKAAQLLTVWLRSRVARSKFLCKKASVDVLTSFYRSRRDRRHFVALKSASSAIARHRRMMVKRRKDRSAAKIQELFRTRQAALREISNSSGGTAGKR